ncbi:Fur family ferric uptake transcriptional regulator [Azospirillum brasilense]|nr:Fur family transcriptional regulator [Azospirillum baldaniorum]TWA62353.1 Fur family ferric uptake transcriptional regulator [Azospirillum baldaniorum]TWA73500.1 Fur family ferric uptake transcriptional regulator [Azospirillum brasilense]
MTSRLESLCLEKGLKMTGQRRVISQVLSESEDHPDVEEVHRRAVLIDPRISIATVYRTMRLLEDAQVIEKVDLGDGRARYEEASTDHHHHLIDTRSGRIIEFASPELEALKERIARELGYRIVGHRLEIYGVPLDGVSLDGGDALDGNSGEGGERR